MSSMQGIVAVRFYQGVFKYMSLDILERLVGRLPDEYDIDDEGALDYFCYDEVEGEFIVNYVKKNVYVDYIISLEDDMHVDISQDDINEIVSQAEELGIRTDSWKIKILQYYNGGCAGISEVE